MFQALYADSVEFTAIKTPECRLHVGYREPCSSNFPLLPTTRACAVDDGLHGERKPYAKSLLYEVTPVEYQVSYRKRFSGSLKSYSKAENRSRLGIR